MVKLSFMTGNLRRRPLVAPRMLIAAAIAMGLAASGAAGPALAAIYKTVDSAGNVTFSDVPPPKDRQAETVTLSEPNTLEFQAPAAGRSYGSADDGSEELSYNSVNIVSPSHDQAIRDNAGSVTIQAQIQPELHAGHLVRFLLDGQEVSRSPSLVHNLQNVDRGTHQVQVEIVNAAGDVVASSSRSTFHLQRYSQNFKNNGARPRPVTTRRART